MIAIIAATAAATAVGCFRVMVRLRGRWALVLLTLDGVHGRRRGAGLGRRAGGSASLVGASLDSAFPLLSHAVLTGVHKSVLDASGARSTFVALLAGLLAVDARVLDLSPLWSHAMG